MKRPWMPLYIADYLRDTAQLTTLEHGAYMLLIMHYWVRGPLPDDLGQLSRIAGIERRHFPRTWERLKVFFDLRDRGPNLAQASVEEGKQLLSKCWHHKRIDQELEKAKRIGEKRALAGALGGMVSRGKSNNQRFLVQAIAKQTGTQSHKYITSSFSVTESEGLSDEKSELERTVRARGWVR